MRYQNPVVRGFNPDPSVCSANGKFYLVTSSFQFFPGVPLFESTDLVNWKQIGHVLTRPSQVMLTGVRASGGVFAPTIREYNGRFYMVTNNNSTNENFYVYTDDIYGEWSDPITVDQDGIDPSLYFEDGRCFFLTNGTDDEGEGGIVQCEIEIETGKKLSPSKSLWKGSGGRYIESPHMYKIGDYYYLMVAEGGTEYGHMITYTRSKSIWGPFEDYAKNPVLTNRNKAPFEIQGIGHGDLIRGNDGNWYMLSLGFRQIEKWDAYHTLGREVFLTPAQFDEEGWFTCGADGTTDFAYEIPGDGVQELKKEYTFANTEWTKEWAFLRDMHPEDYILERDRAVLTGSALSLNDLASPTFVGMRQKEFDMEMSVLLDLKLTDKKEAFTPVPFAGLTVYMDETEHFDVGVTLQEEKKEIVLRLCIGTIRHEALRIPVEGEGKLRLSVVSERSWYRFYAQLLTSTPASGKIFLGQERSKYLSTEVAGGFTGVMIGLFAEGNVEAEFTEFRCIYPMVDKIFFDLDGVLADFNQGVRELTDLEPKPQDPNRDPAYENRLWAEVRAVPNFYDRLKPVEEAMELFRQLKEKYPGKVEILTGIPKPNRKVVTAAEDKRNWVKRLLGEDVVVHTVIRKDKTSFCRGRESILIDDYFVNTDAWKSEGGTTILFTTAEEARKELQQIGLL